MSGLIDTSKFKEFQDQRKAATVTDPGLRRMVQRARIRLVKDQLKEARVGEFTLMSDEAAERGGGGSAPGPLTYFVAAVGFWMFSQLTRYASEFDVRIDRAELDIRIQYSGLGKMMINEASPAAQQVTYTWEIDSPSPREKVSEMLSWIEKGCHTVNSLRQSVPIQGKLELNGAELPFEPHPFENRPSEGRRWEQKMQLPDVEVPPPALDPTITYRENLIEADCESLDRMRKVAYVQGFTVYCDESERVGGEHTAPSPLGYFTAAIGFWLLTQIARYGHMMKTAIQKARVHVTMHNKTEGSVLQGTVRAACLGIEARVELESDQPRDRVAAVIRNAENGCFTMQALLAPVGVTSSVTLNGALLSGAEPQAAR